VRNKTPGVGLEVLMRFALSNDHYAAEWPLEENYKLEDITQLGVRYASLEEGPRNRMCSSPSSVVSMLT
jgi:hypothetical protein